MPPSTIKTIAATRDGVHSNLYCRSIGRFLSDFPAYFQPDHVVAVDPEQWNFCLKNFNSAVKRTLARQGKNDLSEFHLVQNHIKRWSAEELDEFDTVAFYSSSEKKDIAIVFPLKQVFLCIFNLLYNNDVTTESPDKELENIDERLYNLFTALLNLANLEETWRQINPNSSICHTGIRHGLMLALQGRKIFITKADSGRREYTIFFPEGDVENFIEAQIQDHLEKMLSQYYQDEPRKWITIINIWLTQEPSPLETTRLQTFVAEQICPVLESQKSTIEEALYDKGINAKEYEAAIAERITSPDLIIEIKPNYPNTLLSHISNLHSLSPYGSDGRKAQLDYLKEKILAGQSTEQSYVLFEEIKDFLSIEYVNQHFQQHFQRCLTWSGPRCDFNILRILLKEYPERRAGQLDGLRLTDAEKEQVVGFQGSVLAYINDLDRINKISNFFAILFEDSSNALDIHTFAFQQQIFLPDEKIKEFLENASADGVLEIDPYGLNRIFLHALCNPIDQWSEIFSEIFPKVLTYVETELGSLTDGINQVFKASSYPPEFLSALRLLYQAQVRLQSNQQLEGLQKKPEELLPQEEISAELFAFLQKYSICFLNHYQITTLPIIEAFCSVDSENMSGLYGVTAEDDKILILNDRKFLKILLSDPFRKNFLNALCAVRPNAADKLGGNSPLSNLSLNARGRLIIEKCLDALLTEEFCAQFMTALCAIKSTENNDKYTSALLFLSWVPAGLAIIRRCLKTLCREEFKTQFVRALCIIRPGSSEINTSVLFYLPRYATGVGILSECITLLLSEELFRLQFIEALCSICPRKKYRGKYRNISLLYYMAISYDLRGIFEQCIKHQPFLDELLSEKFKAKFIAALCELYWKNEKPQVAEIGQDAVIEQDAIIDSDISKKIKQFEDKCEKKELKEFDEAKIDYNQSGACAFYGLTKCYWHIDILNRIVEHKQFISGLEEFSDHFATALCSASTDKDLGFPSALFWLSSHSHGILYVLLSNLVFIKKLREPLFNQQFNKALDTISVPAEKNSETSARALLWTSSQFSQFFINVTFLNDVSSTTSTEITSFFWGTAPEAGAAGTATAADLPPGAARPADDTHDNRVKHARNGP